MLCCIGIVVGAILVGATGQFYYLPLSIVAGAAGDFLIFRNFISFKKIKGKENMETHYNEEQSCCGLFGFQKKRKKVESVN